MQDSTGILADLAVVLQLPGRSAYRDMQTTRLLVGIVKAVLSSCHPCEGHHVHIFTHSLRMARLRAGSLGVQGADKTVHV